MLLLDAIAFTAAGMMAMLAALCLLGAALSLIDAVHLMRDWRR
jgi:hypothetical protein